MTEVGTGEALDLGRRSLCGDPDCQQRQCRAIRALVAEVERLRAQRDEALAFALAGNDPSLTLQQIVRVLSRTEDGTNG